jgi:inhibitor of cysteine peptidase
MAELQIDKSRNGGRATIQVGDVVVLCLPENPTTGFRWQLLPLDGSAIQLESDSFELATSALGRGGTRRLKFTAVNNGSCVLQLQYRRSWEQRAVESFAMTIEVVANCRLGK